MTGRISANVIIQALLITLAGCSDDKTNLGQGSGMIDVTITVDPTITVMGDVPYPNLDLNLPEASDFTVYITDGDGNKAIWNSISPTGVPERLLPGLYDLSAISGVIGGEGFDSPCFYAAGKAVVENGVTTPVNLTATIANTLVEVDFSPSISEAFDKITATLHTDGAAYCSASSAEGGPVFISPGDVNLSLDVALHDGRECSFALLKIAGAEAATYYRVTLSAGNEGNSPRVTATVSTGQQASRLLADNFVNGSCPEITTKGFVSGKSISLAEGALPDDPALAFVSGDDLEHLYMTIMAPSLGSQINAQVDLLNLSRAEADTLRSLGLDTGNLHPGNMKDVEIDFSRLLTHLRYVAGAIPSTFSLQAMDGAGRVSHPIVLSVELLPVDIDIVKVSDAILGVNIAQIELSSTSPYLEGNIAVEALDGTSGRWTPLNINSVETAAEGTDIVTFETPDGIDTIVARLLFCGKECGRFTIRRSLPAYSLSADPFAHHVNIKVTTTDPDMRGAVTSVLQFFDFKGNRMLLVERNIADGMITISGLIADSDYNLRSGLGTTAPASDQKVSSVAFHTEAVSQLPNPDFESVLYNDFRYDRMPSGGRYSQNSVAIFNRQNYKSFDLLLPQDWATVNDKTFCRQASNHNTWYMAPSTYVVTDAYSGAYAVRIDCVGYDIDGAPIPDYLQTSKPYTEYSLNTPSGYEHATGRLFLGEYVFDPSSMSETYDLGLPFKSRPSSLNGAYKFMPSPANPRAAGIARIEVLGNVNDVEVVIASADMSLTPAMSYTLFSIPLTYRHEGVKASSLRILFAASEAIGDIGSETTNISVTPFPESATLLGSSLWIDNLSLGY